MNRAFIHPTFAEYWQNQFTCYKVLVLAPHFKHNQKSCSPTFRHLTNALMNNYENETTLLFSLTLGEEAKAAVITLGSICPLFVKEAGGAVGRGNKNSI